ncbi:hypothetical protein [Deinococcus multiflagellatus]|uniref:Uncharacterized protein n=1 Tax=Deinococcus multiflagellatus TaxID=1656887 RepID=A0ABW1ZRE3_9DEIO|nr:hypothetical protein [Deinococcus multiflagellatus]MBZ9715523.1 hypothetical protein [Deinococcus multiflagellatus]
MTAPDDLALDLRSLQAEADEELNCHGPEAPGAQQRLQALTRPALPRPLDMETVLRIFGADL